jgi:hypothetical protein
MSQPINANKYFDFNQNYLSSYQKNMYSEAVQMYGFDIKYIPIEFAEDDINWTFGEINKVKYTLAYDLRMKIEGYDDLHKALLNYTKFGMLILPDNLEISVGMNDYKTIVINNNEIMYPKTGDLIYFEIHDESLLFEVVSVSPKYDSFYLFNVKLYNYNALNAIETGIPKIDNITDLDNPLTILDSNERIEETNKEFENPEKQHSIWGNY